MKVKKILVIDDEEIIRNLFKRIFGKEFEVSTASSGKEAIELIKKQDYDVIFIDVVFPKGMDGLEIFREIKKIKPEIKSVMMTGFSVENKVDTAMDEGAYAYIYKPFAADEVKAIVSKIENE